MHPSKSRVHRWLSGQTWTNQVVATYGLISHHETVGVCDFETIPEPSEIDSGAVLSQRYCAMNVLNLSFFDPLPYKYRDEHRY